MIKAKKSLGQNFLIDKNVLEKIVTSTIIKDKIVLEIGPGTGNLTSFILKNKPKEFFVVEKDEKLSINLKNNFENKINIINEDILKLDETKLFKDKVTVFAADVPHLKSCQLKPSITWANINCWLDDILVSGVVTFNLVAE